VQNRDSKRTRGNERERKKRDEGREGGGGGEHPSHPSFYLLPLVLASPNDSVHVAPLDAPRLHQQHQQQQQQQRQ